MPIGSGTQLGPFRIIGPIGAGGMGEVYRALDTRLDRHVALKLILEALVADPDRAMRFEREAKTLAAINHPHIATLYGLEQVDGRHILVMELVEGETLAERIAKHPNGLPLEPALQIARQIAEALEAAHEKGIVHRDLKPANVKITPDDNVKVLDFGLARIAERNDASSSATVANSPTLSVMGTQAGIILGTASYMSPEQARGYTADHRSDIFSFGVVLYEMLTGRQPFPGETISDVLASVLARDPDLAALPADLSPRLIDLVKRCLEKNPKKRWQAIGDVRYELEALQSNPRAVPLAVAAAAATMARRPWWVRARPIVVAVLLTATAVGAAAWLARPKPAPPHVTRFTIVPPDGKRLAAGTLNSFAVSPDGSRIAYVADRQIYVRSIAELEGTPILPSPPGDTVFNLAFSPDGQSIAYTTGNAIMVVPVAGAAAVTVGHYGVTAPLALSWSGSWLFYGEQNKVVRMAATGGEPEVLFELAANETAWRTQLLPDGKTVIFTLVPPGTVDRLERGTLVAQRIGESQRTKIMDSVVDARFVAPEYLVFARQGVLLAIAFDPATLKVSGRPVPVLEGVRRVAFSAQFAISANGSVAYIAGPREGNLTLSRSLILTDRDHAREFLKPPTGDYSEPRLSPDGRTLAYVNTENGDSSIWLYGVNGAAAPRRLTFSGKDRGLVWSADSVRITFQSEREGDAAIFWHRADGSGTAERLTKPEAGTRHMPMSWSPDGTVLLYDSTKGEDVTLMMWRPRDRVSTSFADLRSSRPTGATFSPDGRWVAYTRPTTVPRHAIFVQPFPATGALFQISKSTEDGHHPVWLKHGAELLYSPGGSTGFVVVPLTYSPSFTPGEAQRLPRNFTDLSPSLPRPYDAAPDGRLYALTSEPRTVQSSATALSAPLQPPPSDEVRVVLNWIEEVKRKVPR